jgi:hypothetical protein
MKLDKLIENAFPTLENDDRASMQIYGIVESPSVTETQKILKRKEYPNGLFSVVVEATLQEAEAVNRNTRRYRKNLIDEAMRHPFVTENMRTRNWFGEANHPLTKDPERIMYVDMLRAAMQIYDYSWDGNLLRGVMESMMLTPAGQAHIGAALQGTITAYSMRGFGPSRVTTESVNGQTMRIMDIVKLFIRCYDWVQYPSHAPAYQSRYNIVGRVESGDEALVNQITETADSAFIPVAVENGESFDRLVTKLVETNELRTALKQCGLEPSRITSITENGNLLIEDPELTNSSMPAILVSPTQYFRNEVLGEFFTGLGFGKQSKRKHAYKESAETAMSRFNDRSISKIDRIKTVRRLIDSTVHQTEFNLLERLIDRAMSKSKEPDMRAWLQKYAKLETAIARVRRSS